MEFTVIKHAEVRKEAAKKAPSYDFTPEFIANFDQLWGALKDGHYLDKLSIKFATKEERNKFLRYAKAYGDTKGIFVSNTDVEETKDTPRLNIRMELADAREKRIKERNERNALIAEYKKLGGNPDHVKRGTTAPKDFDLTKEVQKLRAKAGAPQGNQPQAPAKKAAPAPQAPHKK